MIGIGRGGNFWGQLQQRLAVWCVQLCVTPPLVLRRTPLCWCSISTAFFVGLKLSLRSQAYNGELKDVIKNPAVVEKITKVPNIGFACLSMISLWVDARMREGHLDRWQARSIEQYVSAIVDAQGGLERISGTPIPFAYAVHTHQFLLLYLITLPFTMVTTYGYYALVAVFTIAFGLIGIDEAGVEIEDPFGFDDNDLPLEVLFDKSVNLLTAFVDTNNKSNNVDTKSNKKETNLAELSIGVSAGEKGRGETKPHTSIQIYDGAIEMENREDEDEEEERERDREERRDRDRGSRREKGSKREGSERRVKSRSRDRI